MNFTLISEILTELPQIFNIVQALVAAGKGLPEAQNAVQGHELVRKAHPDIRTAVNTITEHLVEELQRKPVPADAPATTLDGAAAPAPVLPSLK